MSKKGRKVEWAILILGIILVFRTGGNVVRLWKAGKWVEEAKKDVAAAVEENKQLQDTLSEVQTPEYQEREARDKLGYGRPGEIVLVIPDQNTAYNSQLNTQEDKIPNWVRWRKLYLGF
jgi:cell division protein FtsB